MKYCICLFLTSLFISTNVLAAQPKIEIIERFDDLRMVAFISIKDIDDSPEWKANLTPPPLTVGEAIQAVNEFSKKTGTLSDIKEIEIRPVPGHESKWHYLIKVANDSKRSKFDIYLVLMNGTVISAMIEPQGYK
jgi:hypothetical protein